MRHKECQEFSHHLRVLDPKHALDTQEVEQIYRGSNVVREIKDIIADILFKLPQKFNTKEVDRKFPLLYEDSINAVLRQEVDQYNALLERVQLDLSTTLATLEGKLSMTPSTEQLCERILNRSVPDSWPTPIGLEDSRTRSLYHWLTALANRVQALEMWVAHGQPTVFWLSAFWNLKALLTALKLNYSRRSVSPLASVGFACEFLKDGIQESAGPPADGAYVRGLFLENASWDPKLQQLVEASLQDRYTEMPIVSSSHAGSSTSSHGLKRRSTSPRTTLPSTTSSIE